MAFYDLTKAERQDKTTTIRAAIGQELTVGKDFLKTAGYFSDEDTYIRKAAYIATGRIYFSEAALQQPAIRLLNNLFLSSDFRIRQTVINAAGEIGMRDFTTVSGFFDKGLLDGHHAVRNAVIGSVKKMGQVNPLPVLSWAAAYLYHEDKEIRREICHGIELRGRTHPQDILPMLKELQHDKTARVRNTLVHVLGQIAYKKGCLETVVADLKIWDNKVLVTAALAEIIDVHERYRNFSFYTQHEATEYIRQHYPAQV